MENNKNKKIIIAVAVFLVVVIVAVIALVASCNSSNKNDEDTTTSSSEEDTYGCTEEVASEDIEDTTEESIAMGDNEVPFDDSVAESMSSSEDSQETIVYEVTEADGSKVTEADGSVVTTVAYVDKEETGDNEVSFDDEPTAEDETTAEDESDTVEEVSTEAIETLPDNVVEVETDKDGWTTDIVKP